MDLKESRCKGIYLHNYSIVADYGRAIKERCSRCGKDIVIKIDSNGNASNNEYLKHHARQALPPQHALYEHEYPNIKKIKHI